ncbi:aldo/keto reductase [Bradyrhizobium sp. HKCCYLS20291]|uniref:aldo/keto reductase n=1 Tax=Bradyrhizobium sp. HKCCYLS20291 TaxID=3420766 RepID=UPI003EB6FEE7
MSGVDVIGTRLGLGCARLGSVLGCDRADALALVQTAYDRGIRFFDTANIYGQGESERMLGAALGSRRKQTTIVTKAGQYFPMWMRAARPLKGVIAPLIRRSGGGRQLLAKTRDAALPQDFSQGYLQVCIDASLRRLKSDYVDLLLLHSPPADIIVRGEAVGHLEKIKAAGKAVSIGISCEDTESALLALNDPRIGAIELPLWPMTKEIEVALDRARQRAILVIGRGLMQAAAPNSDGDRWPAARATLSEAMARGDIGRVLVGTTRLTHLARVLDAFQEQDETCS